MAYFGDSERKGQTDQRTNTACWRNKTKIKLAFPLVP